MPSIGDMARITMKNKPEEMNSVEYRAWIVHQTCVQKSAVQENPVPTNTYYDSSYFYLEALSPIIKEIYPELSSGANAQDRKEIIKYLQGSHNAVRGTQGWWISFEWKGATSKKEEEPVKVTAQEVGKDRPAEPVETSYKCPDCDQVFALEKSMKMHRASAHFLKGGACPECGKEFRNLGVHRAHKHGKSKAVLSQEVQEQEAVTPVTDVERTMELLEQQPVTVPSETLALAQILNDLIMAAVQEAVASEKARADAAEAALAKIRSALS